MGFPYEAPRVAPQNIGAVDASGAPEHFLFVAPCQCVIKSIRLVCGDAIAAAETDSCNITVTNLTASEAVASLSTKTGEADLNAIATNTVEELTLSSTAAYLELDEDDVLQVAFTETTPTTGDLTEAAMFVEWIPGTGAGNA